MDEPNKQEPLENKQPPEHSAEEPLLLPSGTDQVLLHLDQLPQKPRRGQVSRTWALLATGAFLLCLGMLIATLAGTRQAEDAEAPTDVSATSSAAATHSDHIVFVRDEDGTDGGLTPQEIYEKAAAGVICLTDGDGQSFGGFLFDTGGFLATTASAVAGKDSLQATLWDGQRLDALVVASCERADLALLKIEKSGLSALPQGSAETLLTGDAVYTVGTPSPALMGSFAAGSVACRLRALSVLGEDLTPQKTVMRIQTTLSLAGGFEGSPLLNGQGQVVGILCTDTSLAIPMEGAAPILAAMQRGEEPSSALIAAVTIPAADLGLEAEAAEDEASGICGVRIRSFTEQAADVRQKLAVGDLITHVDGTPVTSSAQLRTLLRRYRPEDTVAVTVYRAEQSLTFYVNLVTLS